MTTHKRIDVRKSGTHPQTELLAPLSEGRPGIALAVARSLLRDLPPGDERDVLALNLDRVTEELDLELGVPRPEVCMRARKVRERSRELFELLVVRPIRDAIWREHGCAAAFVDSHVVPELYAVVGSSGRAHAFRLVGHPREDRAYAWFRGEPPQITIVLGDPRFGKAVDAVRASLSRGGRDEKVG